MAASNARTRPIAPEARSAPLGGLPAAAFLRRHWQKKPLLVRGAVPGFAGLFGARELFALAGRDDVESRLVVRHGARWSLSHGPFRHSDLRGLPARDWTLLVQGVNLVSAAADALLRRFAFLPYARLDDLMVSYAVPGGGVGPHVDSYDVFLLQGFGRRRWRYGPQADLALKARVPLKILRRFAPDPLQADVLAPGDMLYLPPHCAHDGVAIDTCTTYSIGFRAAGANELATAFLDYLRDQFDLPGRYADPDVALVRAPAAIDAAMRQRCERMLQGIRWNRATIARFLGCWLSEPKPHVFFDPPGAPRSYRAFTTRAARHGIRLDLRTQLLYDSDHLFVNGTALAWPAAGSGVLRQLANGRALGAGAVAAAPAPAMALVYDWYRDGYLHAEP